MINSTNLVSKIKYDFLESTDNLFTNLVDSKIVLKGKIYYPTFIMPFEYRDNKPCFHNMFCYFEEKHNYLNFYARYTRSDERREIEAYINGNDELVKQIYFLSRLTLRFDIDENNTIYQYYDFDDFKTKFQFYLELKNKKIVSSIKSGEFFKKDII